MSYLEGVRTGYDLTKDLISGGVEEYQKERSYKAALQAKSDAAGNAAYSDAQDRDLKNREFEERVRHDKAVEGEWAPGSRGGHGGAGKMDHDLVFLGSEKKRIEAVMKDHPEDLTPEDRDYYKQLSEKLRDKTGMAPYQKPAATEPKAPANEGGFQSLFRVPLENADKFFKEHSVPAPAAKTMTGTLNGKRVTLTKTAAGWTDESGQVVK